MSCNNAEMRGGGATSYRHLFHARTAAGGNKALTVYGLQNLEKTPMFNPVCQGVGNGEPVLATPTTGAIPNGLWFNGVTVQDIEDKNEEGQEPDMAGVSNVNDGLTAEMTGGGTASGYRNLFHSRTVAPPSNSNLTVYGLKHVENSPMFNPMSKSQGPVATPSSGLTPSGLYYIKAEKAGQEGGGMASSFRHMWYSQSLINNALLSRNADKINQSPMFQPLDMNATIPTVNSGIIPNGLYLSGMK